jgi:hypothetical protein
MALWVAIGKWHASLLAAAKIIMVFYVIICSYISVSGTG